MKKIVILPILLGATLLLANVNIEMMPNNPQRENATNKNTVLSYNNSIKSMQKSVVNISSTKNVTSNVNMQNLLNNPFLKNFFGNNIPKFQPQSRTAHSLGSGVIISKDGYIVTNDHVVEGADYVTVTIHGNKKIYKAKIIGQDPKTDLAVIKIDAKNLHVAQFGDSSKLLEGDIVFAIGNPFGVGESVTQGIISALNKSSIGLNQYENFIQTDASINPGNSGGALVDTRGALIGINSAIISRSGGNNGIGFAIPSNMVKSIAINLINNGAIKRGYLGVSITDLKANMRGLYKNDSGALILQVEKNSSAAKAGLKRGDLIIQINGKKIKNANELKNKIGDILPNKTIKIKYERNKKIKNTKAILADMGTTKSFGNSKNKAYIKGLSVTELTNKIKSIYKIPADIKGVFVTRVKNNSQAQKIGFLKGDIIVQVQNKFIKSLKDLNEVFAKNKNKPKMIYVNRGGYIIYFVAK
ncbi:MAG: Do family serine endopeptidase [Epsilonproteobacteria bacterium]|nr:Do family serine endopeptidase [Campylobacterota bacterium]